MTEEAKQRAFAISLRAWGIISLFIFLPLLVGLITKTRLLREDGGVLNWAIWNDAVCPGPTGECHVPPMLFIIYIVWAVFVLVAAKQPRRYASFLAFTMWANLAHGLLMAGQALTEMSRYWSKFLTDVPWVLSVALAIYLFRPAPTEAST